MMSLWPYALLHGLLGRIESDRGFEDAHDGVDANARWTRTFY